MAYPLFRRARLAAGTTLRSSRAAARRSGRGGSPSGLDRGIAAHFVGGRGSRIGALALTLGLGASLCSSGVFSTSRPGIAVTSPQFGGSDLLGSAMRAGTTIALTSSRNPAEVHAPVTLTAKVTRQGLPGVPTGSVRFYGGSVTISTVPLDSKGTARLTTTALAVWITSVRASYGGDGADRSSNITIPQTIQTHPTSVQLVSSANPGKVGLEITFTATVTSPANPDGTPAGSVLLMDGSTSPATLVASRYLDPTSTATFSKIILASGAHPLTAAYQGRGFFGPATSTVFHQQVGGSAYAGALPFAFESGYIKSQTNVLRRAQDLAATPAAGISWRFAWADLEPSPGVYDWSAVDNSITASRAVHLPVILRVVAGMSSPAWVVNGVPTVTTSNLYTMNTDVFPNPTIIPVVWQSSYLSDWLTFIRAFGARYNGASDLYLVQMSGAGLIGDMYLPPNMTAWNAAGYSDANLLSAWEQIVTAYDQAFPNTPVGLGLADGLKCSAVSKGFTNPTCSPSYASNVMVPLADWVSATYPHRVFLQNNGLKPSYINSIFTTRQVLRAACQSTVIGYQMGVFAAGPADTHTSFEVARQDQTSYVEVYSQDILDPMYAADLHYLRYGA